MKHTANTLSQRYATELRKHLKRGPRATLRPARGLGRLAVALGLETLDLAKIHERALATLEMSPGWDEIRGRAEFFFTEAITPIEKTHGAALKTNVRLNRLSKVLSGRMRNLAAVNRSLRQGITHRKTIERDLKATSGHSKKLLEESRRLQKQLRQLTHQILLAQEDKRKNISRELQDDIAQILVGINVRLWSLKQGATVGTERLRKEIASTRRLVDKSMKSIKRFAREFGSHHET